MGMVGGSGNVHVSFPAHPGAGGRYISFNLLGSAQQGQVAWGEEIVFHPSLPTVEGDPYVEGGPFPLTVETVRAVAEAGVSPNDFGSGVLWPPRPSMIQLGQDIPAWLRSVGRSACQHLTAEEMGAVIGIIGDHGWAEPAVLREIEIGHQAGGIDLSVLSDELMQVARLKRMALANTLSVIEAMASVASRTPCVLSFVEIPA